MPEQSNIHLILGFFQYVRRSDLLQHIQHDDELRLTVSVTTYSDTVMRHGNYLKSERSDINQSDETVSFSGFSIRLYRLFSFHETLNRASTTIGLRTSRSTLASDSRFSMHIGLYCRHDLSISRHCWRRTQKVNELIVLQRLIALISEASEGKVEYPELDFEVFSELLFFIYTGKSPRIRTMASWESLVLFNSVFFRPLI